MTRKDRGGALDGASGDEAEVDGSNTDDRNGGRNSIHFEAREVGVARGRGGVQGTQRIMDKQARCYLDKTVVVVTSLGRWEGGERQRGEAAISS